MSTFVFWAINIVGFLLWLPSTIVLFKAFYKSPKNLVDGLRETKGREHRTLFEKGLKTAVGNELYEIGIWLFGVYSIMMYVVCRTMIYFIAKWLGYTGS